MAPQIRFLENINIHLNLISIELNMHQCDNFRRFHLGHDKVGVVGFISKKKT